MSELVKCQCSTLFPVAEQDPCEELATQEDMLCEFCRNYHALLGISPGHWVSPPCHQGL